MKHTRYLGTHVPLCEDPSRLGRDFVTTDMGEGTICPECSALLFTHNKKAFEEEMAYQAVKGNLKVREDGLRPARGCINGVLISSLFWIVLILGLYLYFFRG